MDRERHLVRRGGVARPLGAPQEGLQRLVAPRRDAQSAAAALEGPLEAQRVAERLEALDAQQQAPLASVALERAPRGPRPARKLSVVLTQAVGTVDRRADVAPARAAVSQQVDRGGRARRVVHLPRQSPPL